MGLGQVMVQAEETAEAAGNTSSALGSALLLLHCLLHVLAPLNPRAEIPLGHVGILQASVTSLGCCPVTQTTRAAFPPLWAGSWQG